MSSVAAAVEAIKTGEIDKLRSLVDAEPSLSTARDENGVSLVMLACYYRSPAALRYCSSPIDHWRFGKPRRWGVKKSSANFAGSSRS